MFDIREKKKLLKDIEDMYQPNFSNQFLSYTQKIDVNDLLVFLSNKSYENKYQFLFENNKSHLSYIGLGCVEKVEIFNSTDLEKIPSLINQRLNSITNISATIYASPKFFGGYAFDINTKPDNNWAEFPKGYFVLPEIIITSFENNSWITIIQKLNNQETPDEIYNSLKKKYDQMMETHIIEKISKNNIVHTHNNIEKESYLNTVNEIINQIKTEDIKKLVFSRFKHLEFDNPFNWLDSIKLLRDTSPQCINFSITIPDRGIFFGSTPERLIKKHKMMINTEAVAGTAPRGGDNEEDDYFANKLKNDKKNYKEHQFVIQEIKRKLNSKLTDMKISEKPSILKLNNIQHLISDISGELKEDTHILKLVEILHPTPAVAGIPVDRTLELIRQYENHDRGWYSGPVGWVDKDGDGDFCVALRSAIANGKSINIFSGGGIVEDSIAEKEWDETEMKFQTILLVL